jgi:hypothetical protein
MFIIIVIASTFQVLAMTIIITKFHIILLTEKVLIVENECI